MASEKKKFAGRLNEALDEAGFPPLGNGRRAALARLMEVPSHMAGKWLKGEAFPATSKLVKLAQHLGVRSNWLLTGAGAKRTGALADGAAGGRAPARAPGSWLSPEAVQLARAWMSLPELQRVAIRRVIDELAGQNGGAESDAAQARAQASERIGSGA